MPRFLCYGSAEGGGSGRKKVWVLASEVVTVSDCTGYLFGADGEEEETPVTAIGLRDRHSVMVLARAEDVVATVTED